MSNLFRAIYKSDYHLPDRINNIILSPHTFTNANTPVQLGCHGQPGHASLWSETGWCLPAWEAHSADRLQGRRGCQCWLWSGRHTNAPLWWFRLVLVWTAQLFKTPIYTGLLQYPFCVCVEAGWGMEWGECDGAVWTRAGNEKLHP